jgi:hypothetical protein
MVQARWGHLNPDSSTLTAAQALALDKHFVIEQTVRHRAGLFPKFNGTAGVSGGAAASRMPAAGRTTQSVKTSV